MPDEMKKNSEIRILVVDDEDVMGYLIRRVLEEEGYRMDWVKDCESAWTRIKSAHYHVIISDYKLPGITGDLFYHQIVEYDPDLARRMVFISGDTINRQILGFFRKANLPYLSKPFEIDALKLAIERIIESSPA